MANTAIPTPGPRVKNLVGQKFGRLTVMAFGGSTPKGHATWMCKCECGKEKTIPAGSIVRGNTKSCGCLLKDSGILYATKHGMSHSAEYQVWHAMKQRTTNPNHPDFHRYGGRGITTCEAWLSSFENFFDDMGMRPSADHSLERKDNSIGYSRENCRWATRREQQRNLRTTKFLIHDGVRLSLSEWAEVRGIPVDCLRRRIRKKWTIERALNTPAETDPHEDDYESLLP